MVLSLNWYLEFWDTSTQTTRIYATPSIEMMKDAMGVSINGLPDEQPILLEDEEELARLCGLR